MTKEQIALAKRAVACKGWRWMDGMVTTGGVRLVDGEYCATRLPSLLPNLTDPATLGCVLALVREAWGKADAYVMPWDDDDGGWTVCVLDAGRCRNVSEGDTEAEALVAALEAAP